MKNLIIITVVLTYYMSRNKVIKTVFSEQLTKNFTLGELLVTRKPFPNIPNVREKGNLKLLAVNVLQPVRDLLGVPVTVNSAFRSDRVNKAVGGVDNSQHRLGFAADIVPKGLDIDLAFRVIVNSNIPYDQIIIETDGDGNRWIHISYNPNGGRRQKLVATWDYSKNKMKYTNYA